jgi:hypothetical protein
VAHVARLDLEPMSAGQVTTGSASEGEKRSKSGRFAAVPDADGAKGPVAKNPASLAPEAPDIDSGWGDTVGEGSEAPTSDSLTPQRVITIGPPAQSPSAEQRANAAEAFDRNVVPRASDADALKRLLTEGPEDNFAESEIGRLVSDVMSGQKLTSSRESNVAVRAAEPAVEQPHVEAAVGETEPIPLVSPKRLSKPPLAVSDALLDPDAWEAPSQPAANTASEPSPAKLDEAPLEPASTRAKIASKPASQSKRATGKGRPAEGLDAEWGGEFFSSHDSVHARLDGSHEHEELIDERHLRALSPEVRARRAKYRVIVLGLFVAMLLLLAAAIALQYLGKQ